MQARIYDMSWELLASGCEFTSDGPITKNGTAFSIELPLGLQIKWPPSNAPIFIETPAFRCEARILKNVGSTATGLAVSID